VWGNYWIIELGADYGYAVVGEPRREYLWILSRTPAMDESTFQGIIDRAREKGFDVSKIVRTAQTH
jgi:apolipoprotein D and lipocalin family protein